MSNKSSKSNKCLFCDGSHKSEKCILFNTNSPKTKNLIKIMDNKNVPNFQDYSITQLRLLCALFCYDNSTEVCSVLVPKKNNVNFNKIVGYNPINLIQSKKQLIKNLIEKWKFRKVLLEKKELGLPNVEHDAICPVCMEDMVVYKWYHNEYKVYTKIQNIKYTRIRKNVNYKYIPGYNPIKTSCGHVFCSHCWGKIIDNIHFRVLSDYNFKLDRNTIKDRLYNWYSANCPLCRTNCIIDKRLGLDKDKTWFDKHNHCPIYFIRPKTYENDGTNTYKWCDEPTFTLYNWNDISKLYCYCW